MSANKQLKNIKGAGRPSGSPNKATAAAREAIATFVDGNAHRLQEWLDKIAEGVYEYDKDGNPVDCLVQPNPEKAFMLFQSVVEYHVPKLARQELVGDESKPIKHIVTWKKTT